ncbi:MAG TPA: glycosyl transferase family 1 [Phycisphaerales bacterium]|nr:glycosyl transferase family 1 [Phycisphaerales bacterium]HCD34011.1 glycosyl transferase family 1 [Phycisphaerales bacterium]|tara:strand:+ start:755 stop:1885 length:1131 start_codon:yes stop_codon:yes gene_type:complete
MSADSKPVIGHVLHQLAYAGAEVLAAALARQLADRYQTVFLCLDGLGKLGEALQSEGFRVVELGRKPGIDLAVSRRIKQAVKEHGIDLLHAHQYTPFFYASLSRKLGSKPPLLFTEHGRHYPDQRKLKRVIANKFLWRQHDRATAVGRFVARALVSNEGFPRADVQVIYNGIDPDTFMLPNQQQLRYRMRDELKLTEDQPVILQVARFHPVKDHATSIKAFSHVVEQLPNAVLLLAGDGQDKPVMQALAKQLGVADHVRFLGVRTDIPHLMTAADAFVLSSLSEGISVTLLEAMASGVPICTTDVGGNGEIVEHTVTGLLSPRQDAKALGANLVQMLIDPPLRQKFVDASRRKLLAQFNQQQMHDAYTKLYDSMIH